jgi:hypothetical protein
MTQLRILSSVGAMDGVQQQQQQPNAAAAAVAAATAATPLRALLDALPGLSQLEDMLISNTSEADVAPLPASEVGRYAALLHASTHLTALELSWGAGCLLPGDCWEHVFAAGWQLPQLKRLWIGVPGSMWDRADEQLEIAQHIAQIHSCFGPDEVSRLVQRCPALELSWAGAAGLGHARFDSAHSADWAVCWWRGSE